MRANAHERYLAGPKMNADGGIWQRVIEVELGGKYLKINLFYLILRSRFIVMDGSPLSVQPGEHLLKAVVKKYICG
jgi:hypothetical protein